MCYTLTLSLYTWYKNSVVMDLLASFIVLHSDQDMSPGVLMCRCEVPRYWKLHGQQCPLVICGCLSCTRWWWACLSFFLFVSLFLFSVSLCSFVSFFVFLSIFLSFFCYKLCIGMHNLGNIIYGTPHTDHFSSACCTHSVGGTTGLATTFGIKNPEH